MDLGLVILEATSFLILYTRFHDTFSDPIPVQAMDAGRIIYP